MSKLATWGLLSFTLAACSGASEEASVDEIPMVSVSDSLIPIADEITLPEDRPAAPPETVYVAAKTPPPPARQPVIRQTPPPAAAPAPPPAAVPAPPPAAAPAPPPAAAPSSLGLDSGTELASVTLDSVHSRYNSVGDPIRVRVTSDLMDGEGRVVIPAGAVVTLSITEIKPAPNRGDAGTLVLSGQSVAIDGVNYPITARASDFEYQLKGRGITGDEVKKTGIGAVAGGLIGRVVGGKKGTVIGAIGGAAAGAAVADQQADRDIIVVAGTPMTIVLRDTFERP